MRFLLNMSVSPKLGDALRARGHDARHCRDAGLAVAPDDTVLDHARLAGEVIVTADHDFPRLVVAAGTPGPGIVLLRLDNPDAETAIRRLGQTLDELGDDADLHDTIVVVEPDRLRLHRLHTT